MNSFTIFTDRISIVHSISPNQVPSPLNRDPVDHAPSLLNRDPADHAPSLLNRDLVDHAPSLLNQDLVALKRRIGENYFELCLYYYYSISYSLSL